MPTTTSVPQANEADQRYLVEALRALRAAAELSNVAAVRAADVDVRALARWTLAAQSRLIRTVVACLEAGGRPGICDVPLDDDHHRLTFRPATLRLQGLSGAALDRAFVAELTSHIQRSSTRARAEMVDGHHPGARGLAEEALRKHAHELAVIEDLAKPG